MCFIDYTKTFDRVRHDEITTQRLKIDEKDPPVIKDLYLEQLITAMRVDVEICSIQNRSINVADKPAYIEEISYLETFYLDNLDPN